MRKFRIPTMGALMAFEAAARHESFTHAGRELSLTESAVSRQIGSLEQRLGVRLFVRSRQRVMLTRAGRLYASQVRGALEQLDRDTLALMAHGAGGARLELSVLPTFASHWLIPRMIDFQSQHPDIHVNMSVHTDVFAFEQTHFDAAIHYGEPMWPATCSDYLFGESVIPVCRADLLAGPIRTPSQLLEYPLLHSTTRPEAWPGWFAKHGIEDRRSLAGMRYELHTMLIGGAMAGLGIALVPHLFVQSDLSDARLVCAYGEPHAEEAAYYLVYPTELSHSLALAAFRDWIKMQANTYRTSTQSANDVQTA